MKRILYKYPSRQRRKKLFDSLERFFNLVQHENYKVLLTLDEDDPTMSFDKFFIRPDQKVEAVWGFSKGKIDAINRNMEHEKDWDILVLLSDDMVLQPRFDIEILKAFEDGFSGLAHFPDGIANERLCTFTVMDRAYYELFGYIYNPIYKSVAADNEQHEVAVKLGRYKYIPVDIVRHLHPAYGMAPIDDLYIRNENPVLYAEDLNTLRNRRAENFGIKTL
jgi:hypothetical protein